MSFDQDVFKAAMGQLAAGVTVVTTRAGETDAGFTATSPTSLSMEPMLMLICIDKGIRSHAQVTEAGSFAVNILATAQKELGERFAFSKMPDRFEGLEITRGTTGSPILPGNLAWCDCKVVNTVDAGDHTIFIGEVVDGGAPGEGEALLYYNRAWGKFEKV